MPMPTRKTRRRPAIGWIGAGRMGYEMAGRLARGGADVLVWNRTKEKAEPLAKTGARVAAKLSELSGCDIVFCMVSTWRDVKEVMAKLVEHSTAKPRLVVECSSISLEGSAELRQFLEDREDYLVGMAVLERQEPTISLEELERRLGLAR